MKPSRCLFAVAAVWGIACASTGAVAATCEELRTEIEAKISTAGVARFTVTIADAAAPMPPAGRVVGSCDRGARSIVYEVQGGAASALPGAPAPRPRGSSILTECRDGTQTVGGDCKN